MATATIPVPDVMQFKLDTDKQFKEVRHYDLIDGKETLSNKINIGINRGFSKAHYIYSLKIRLETKWSKQITGLFSTPDPVFYYGDTYAKTNTIVMRFVDNGNIIKAYYFSDYYTRRITDLLKYIKENY
ncbi:hypothetical protein [Maribacter stanieri]|uniref:hypothetical protein n=1 Tax=Maribacter stanieri TaxID=440514 RepID=UPI0030DB19B2|tara:strand:+ start:59 stop:445 length:387 start_codon:yes stop_codon:yes gene_type:complete